MAWHCLKGVCCKCIRPQNTRRTNCVELQWMHPAPLPSYYERALILLVCCVRLGHGLPAGAAGDSCSCCCKLLLLLLLIAAGLWGEEACWSAAFTLAPGECSSSARSLEKGAWPCSNIACKSNTTYAMHDFSCWYSCYRQDSLATCWLQLC